MPVGAQHARGVGDPPPLRSTGGGSGRWRRQGRPAAGVAGWRLAHDEHRAALRDLPFNLGRYNPKATSMRQHPRSTAFRNTSALKKRQWSKTLDRSERPNARSRTPTTAISARRRPVPVPDASPRSVAVSPVPWRHRGAATSARLTSNRTCSRSWPKLRFSAEFNRGWSREADLDTTAAQLPPLHRAPRPARRATHLRCVPPKTQPTTLPVSSRASCRAAGRPPRWTRPRRGASAELPP